jgi:DNA-binding transcriptional ArsR family regulator
MAMETLLRSLGDEKRCEILRLVWSNELPAAAIAAHFPDVTRSAISQHLGVLRRAELVHERREGPRRLYRANQHELARIRAFVDSFWTSSLERLKEVAEAAVSESESSR